VTRIDHAVGGDALVHGLNDHLNSVDGLGLVQNVDVQGRQFLKSQTHALVMNGQ